MPPKPGRTALGHTGTRLRRDNTKESNKNLEKGIKTRSDGELEL